MEEKKMENPIVENTEVVSETVETGSSETPVGEVTE